MYVILWVKKQNLKKKLRNNYRALLRIGIIFSFLLIFGGCGKRQLPPIQHDSVPIDQQEPVSSAAWDQQEMMLIDIPIPLYNNRLPIFSQNDQCVDIMLGYQTLFSQEELIDFYEREMERFGWSRTKLFQGTIKTIICYETPYRMCIISLRSSSKPDGTDLYILTGHKDNNT